MPSFLGNSGLKHHLQQQIAQFIADVLQIAALDGVGCLIGFLDSVGCDRFKGLFDVPRAPFFRVAQMAHYLDDPIERVTNVIFTRRFAVKIGGIGAGIFHSESVERINKERNSDGALILLIISFTKLFLWHRLKLQKDHKHLLGTATALKAAL